MQSSLWKKLLIAYFVEHFKENLENRTYAYFAEVI